jgi:hypothetical protein
MPYLSQSVVALELVVPELVELALVALELVELALVVLELVELALVVLELVELVLVVPVEPLEHSPRFLWLRLAVSKFVVT